MVVLGFVFLGVVGLGNGYVVNIDPNYASWPSGIVYYTFPLNEYTPMETNLIRQAMQQIQTDMGDNCIRFQEFTTPAPPAGKYVVITRNGGLTGPAGQSCYTFPGMVASQSGQGQYMAMQGGINGCLNSVRQAMRILASLLGLRSEHNKPNRNNFLQINFQNLNSVALADNVFNTYDPTKVFTSATSFDYNSITLIDPFSFTNNGGLSYVVPMGVILRNTGRLSLADCQALRYMYSCSNQCADIFGGPLFQTTTPAFPFNTFPTPSPTLFPTQSPPPLRPDFR